MLQQQKITLDKARCHAGLTAVNAAAALWWRRRRVMAAAVDKI